MSPLLVGIEIGGTKLQLGLGRGDGEILVLDRRVIVPSAGARGILAQIEVAYKNLTEHQTEDVAAIGLGFGGPVDVGRGLTTTSHQVKGWDQFPLADWVKRTLRVERVQIQNDADTAGLAEATLGAGVGFSPMLYVTIGSGIGGGLIIDGQIYRGGGFGATEIGHLWVRDPFDKNGSRVVLEQVASGWGIANRARQVAIESVKKSDSWVVLDRCGGEVLDITTQAVADAAFEQDPRSLAILEGASDAFAEGLRQAVTLLAPRCIVLGGGVSLMEDHLWLRPVREKLHRDSFPPFRGTYDLVRAKLGEDVVVQGALANAKQALM